MEEVVEESVPVLLKQNQEIALAQLTVLMRIYDIQMAILTQQHPDRADEIYDRHENGGTFGPDIYLLGESE